MLCCRIKKECEVENITIDEEENTVEAGPKRREIKLTSILELREEIEQNTHKGRFIDTINSGQYSTPVFRVRTLKKCQKP